MKVTDGILKLDCTKGGYVYAIICGDGVTLIDTGMPGKGAAILAELAAAGIKPDDVKKILLTHHDVDHIGSAAFLQEKTGCKIYISELDYPYVMEGRKRDGLKAVFSALMKPVKPKEVIKITGDKIDEISVLPTPGHTMGHTAFRFKNAIFCGDLIRSSSGKFRTSPAIMNKDKAVQQNSIKTLPVEGVKWFCMAHGEPLEADGWAAFVKTMGTV
ncbi:MAG: MBL fold metallo-hydrolase [Treponema sp.]|nr:MBL fold metallo-hydrolase [Treponema sp.]